MANFEDAVEKTLENEGGYVDDPKDPGGETKYGISKSSYPNVDIKNLTKEQAKDIYRNDFWMFDGIRSQPVATKLFDAYVNEGRLAIRWAQYVSGVSVDGFYGTITEKAINAMDEVVFMVQFRQTWVNHIIDLAESKPSMAKFVDGLLRRARQ